MQARGFTLIELLVVVTIIVVLLALLVPSLDKAIEAAERTVCAANLDAWGIAHGTYYMDQRRRILSTMRTSSQYPNPNFCWGRSELAANTAGTRDADFSARAMKPYVTDTDLQTFSIRGIWACPSNSAPLKDEVANRQGNGTGGVVATSGYFQPDYAYFAHSEIWGADHATRPRDLTGRAMESGRLLMADVVWRWRVNKTWYYNHGPDGYSVHDAAWGGPVKTDPPMISGTNQLFGDGSVTWKDGTRFDVQKMLSFDTSIGWVSHQGSDGTPDSTGDINYY